MFGGRVPFPYSKRMAAIDEMLAGFPVVIELPVVWGEMDAYRHVNNVVYFRYFETARVEYVRQIGWLEVENTTDIGPILHSTEARFRRALTFPDRISVGTRVIAMQEDRFVLEHRIFSHAQQALTTDGKGIVVAYHYPTQKKAAIPDEVRRRIIELEGDALHY